MGKIKNNFECLNCKDNYYYSPFYRSINWYCLGCLDTGISGIRKQVAKLFNVPTTLGEYEKQTTTKEREG